MAPRRPDRSALLPSLRDLLPGLAFLVVLALVARGLAAFVPVPALLVAVLVGGALANTVGVPDRFESGVGTYDLWLEVGIVLMGVRVSLDALVEAGPRLLLAVVGVVGFTLAVAELLARGFDLQRRLGSLVAAGASVCGVSAVVAVAGAIRADEEHVAYATSTILVFDALTLFAYPALGQFLGLADRTFGIWAGLTMFSTGPVTAAGFAYSEVAGQWATVAKLTRNVLLGGLVVAYSVVYAEASSGDESGPTAAASASSFLRSLWDGFPKFVLGFLSLVALASAGVFTDPQLARIEQAYRAAFLVAFAGLGTSVALSDLRETGVRPLAVLALTLAVVSAVALVVVRFAF
ncbi:YeiH family protein [Halorussus gelatinilyticus]|uniref:YeiH family protein n=1 Tax=Halorussus gelatinilyticus TaxID=2937524 RepID=A0A8U0IHV2_9EURY|nr:putative sulfate exporter family transporter [Halorussus gelatinilyticus]UPW00285.1 YeiH family protein [Halorussus gelatinilyticus]